MARRPGRLHPLSRARAGARPTRRRSASAAFALTTFVLSMFNAGLVNKAGEPVVLGLALGYGGIAQILAGMWEFRTGNTFGAVAFTSFGAFWLSFWALLTFFAGEIPAANVGDAVGLYLIAWGIFTTYMFVASLRTTVADRSCLLPAGGDLLPARDRQLRRIRTAWSKPAAGSAWRRLSLPGMHRSRRSPTRPSVGRCCRSTH